MAKLSGDTQSQPQLNPVWQKSLRHTRLYQWDSQGVPLSAGLGVFPNGALSYEADNLTGIFIE